MIGLPTREDYHEKEDYDFGQQLFELLNPTTCLSQHYKPQLPMRGLRHLHQALY